MYFMLKLCCLCLQTKGNFCTLNTEILYKLSVCIENIDALIELITPKYICQSCANKLNIAFYFKKVCADSINQFRKYVTQLQNTIDGYNKFEDIQISVEELNHQVVEIRSNYEYEGNSVENLTGFIEDYFEPTIETYAKSDCINPAAENLEVLLEVEDDYILKNNCLLLEHTELATEEVLQSIETSELVGHALSHSCSICGTKFNNLTYLKKHMLSHSDDHHACTVCGMGFNRRSSLENHIQIHTNEYKYPCSTCGKRFKANWNLKKHELIHAAERPFSCVICEKGFNQKRDLNQHMLMHTDKHPYSCSTCGKGYISPGELKRHMRYHTDYRPYSCSVCEKRFHSRGNLTSHMTCHSKERPYCCLTCGKCFNLSASLRRHMLIHTDERPHACSLCEKSFHRKDDLRRHTLVHYKNLVIPTR